MDKLIKTKPRTIQQHDISRIAQQGLQRALAARHLTELTLSELENVAGGADDTDTTLSVEPILTGKYPPPPPILMGRFAFPKK